MLKRRVWYNANPYDFKSNLFEMTTGTFPPGQIFSTRLFLPPAQTTRRPTETPNVGGISVFWSCSTYSVMLSLRLSLYWSDLIPMSPSKYSGRSPTLPPAASATFASSSTSFLIHSLGFHHIWLLGSGHKWQFCPQKKNVLFWFYSLYNNCELLSKINNLTVVDKMTGTWSRQVEVWRGRQTGARLVGLGTSLSSSCSPANWWLYKRPFRWVSSIYTIQEPCEQQTLKTKKWFAWTAAAARKQEARMPIVRIMSTRSTQEGSCVIQMSTVAEMSQRGRKGGRSRSSWILSVATARQTLLSRLRKSDSPDNTEYR